MFLVCQRECTQNQVHPHSSLNYQALNGSCRGMKFTIADLFCSIFSRLVSNCLLDYFCVSFIRSFNFPVPKSKLCTTLSLPYSDPVSWKLLCIAWIRKKQNVGEVSKNHKPLLLRLCVRLSRKCNKQNQSRVVVASSLAEAIL